MNKTWTVIAFSKNVDEPMLKRSGFKTVQEAVEYFEDFHNYDSWIEVTFTNQIFEEVKEL